MKLAAVTALLVDADRVARHGCWSLLETHGMGACYQADSAEDAYPLLEQHSPDVVVQAWAMDKPDPLGFIRQVGKHAKACPVIAYSSHGCAFDVLEVLRAGAAAYVTKVSTVQVLLESIRRVLHGERYISPDVAQRIVFCRATRMADPCQSLSQRERGVFESVVAGLDTAEIAARLDLAEKEVSNYLARAERKLGVGSVAGLVRLDLCRRYAAQWNCTGGES